MLVEVIYWFGVLAVASMAAAAVLEAGHRKFDLFGVVIIALTGALGGGSIRDMLLSRPVFWVVDQTYLYVVLIAACTTFWLARKVRMPKDLFLIPDALGLALFAVIGTRAALGEGAPWLAASFLGVVTGVMGGIMRDIICNEIPLVFQGTLYATAAWLGTLVYLMLLQAGIAPGAAELCGGAFIFLLRVAAIRWTLGLPVFRTRIDSV